MTKIRITRNMSMHIIRGIPGIIHAYAEVESPLGYDTTTNQYAIDSMVPKGATPLRYGLYKAIKEING